MSNRQLLVKTIDEEELTVLCLQYTLIPVNYIDVRLQEIYVDYNRDDFSPRDVKIKLFSTTANGAVVGTASNYLQFKDTKAYRCGEYYYFQNGDRLIKYKPYTPSVLEDHIALRFE